MRKTEPCPSWKLGSSVEAQSTWHFPESPCLLAAGQIWNAGFSVSHIYFSCSSLRILYLPCPSLFFSFLFFFFFFLKSYPGGEGKLVCIVCMQRAPQPLKGSQCLQAPLDLIGCGGLREDWERSVWNPRSKDLQQPVLAFHCLCSPVARCRQLPGPHGDHRPGSLDVAEYSSYFHMLHRVACKVAPVLTQACPLNCFLSGPHLSPSSPTHFKSKAGPQSSSPHSVCCVGSVSLCWTSQGTSGARIEGWFPELAS